MAAILFIWLFWVVETKGNEIVELLVWPVFTFGALAFGIDWWGKSGAGMQRDSEVASKWTKSSGERPSGEDERPKSWNV